MTNQNPEADPAAGQAEAEAEGCENCLGARVVLLAVAFAVFAAYVAADFATGGRLTSAALGVVAAVRGQAREGEQ